VQRGTTPLELLSPDSRPGVAGEQWL